MKLPKFRFIDSANSEITAFSAEHDGGIVETECFLTCCVAETTLVLVTPGEECHSKIVFVLILTKIFI